jgi:single-strand DNA-binding protein
MAVGETTVTLVGNVVSELTQRTMNGHEVVSFWMRSSERRRDKESGAWVDGRHLSVKVTCWRNLAESVRVSIGKGDPVIVTGRMFSSDYEAEGQPRSIPELEASAVGPNLGRCTATVQRMRRPRAVERPEFLGWQPKPGPGPARAANALVNGVESLPAA